MSLVHVGSSLLSLLLPPRPENLLTPDAERKQALLQQQELEARVRLLEREAYVYRQRKEESFKPK